MGLVLSSASNQDLWVSLESMFASHPHAKEFQICFQLTNMSRGDLSILDYFGKVRLLADSLATTGNPLPDKEIVTYLLIGLGSSYESFNTFVTTRAALLSSNDLYQLLLIQEARASHSTQSPISSVEPSVNFSTTGGRDQRGRGAARSGHQGRGRGRYPFHNRGGRTFSSNNPSPHYTAQRPTCQVCNKSGMVLYSGDTDLIIPFNLML
ncbi:uncharacterized protein LOC121237697 [Juglans microcarpa x Juglans regia]|uniref:uncharacterized protein LOC121237697 n=1 Tax=Juglans microcarpa x Juglans regia TaxID=2249226 RepID=UPI001B7F3F70|nr:uncharacterized protein LOC121237697 [Juglans microcarpa x Juglans regia]